MTPKQIHRVADALRNLDPSNPAWVAVKMWIQGSIQETTEQATHVSTVGEERVWWAGAAHTLRNLLVELDQLRAGTFPLPPKGDAGKDSKDDDEEES